MTRGVPCHPYLFRSAGLDDNCSSTGSASTPSGVYRDRWFLFNDAEVKPFDPHQIPAECFGGELTSKTYDQLTDKFMDFSFEKTNSAYMLFYERLSSIKADDKKARERISGKL